MPAAPQSHDPSQIILLEVIIVTGRSLSKISENTSATTLSKAQFVFGAFLTST